MKICFLILLAALLINPGKWTSDLHSRDAVFRTELSLGCEPITHNLNNKIPWSSQSGSGSLRVPHLAISPLQTIDYQSSSSPVCLKPLVYQLVSTTPWRRGWALHRAVFYRSKLMRPNKAEIQGCHYPGDMVVRMCNLLVISRSRRNPGSAPCPLFSHFFSFPFPSSITPSTRARSCLVWWATATFWDSVCKNSNRTVCLFVYKHFRDFKKFMKSQEIWKNYFTIGNKIDLLCKLNSWHSSTRKNRDVPSSSEQHGWQLHVSLRTFVRKSFIIDNFSKFVHV